MKPPIVLLTLFVGAVVGCGSKGPPTGNVNGAITFESAPVEEGNVVFENPAKGLLRAAPLREGGNYELKAIDVAEYRVSIRPPDPDLPNENTDPVDRIRITPSMFPDPKNIPKPFRATPTTPLRANVVEGENEFDFDLAATP